jgi:hypothetical protein
VSPRGRSWSDRPRRSSVRRRPPRGLSQTLAARGVLVRCDRSQRRALVRELGEHLVELRALIVRSASRRRAAQEAEALPPRGPAEKASRSRRENERYAWREHGAQASVRCRARGPGKQRCWARSTRARGNGGVQSPRAFVARRSRKRSGRFFAGRWAVQLAADAQETASSRCSTGSAAGDLAQPGAVLGRGEGQANLGDARSRPP